MSENLEIKIKNHISLLIDSTFKKLIVKHKELLKTYLTLLCVTLYRYFSFENYYEQIIQNNSRDIFSLLVLFLPYYNLNSSSQITDLGELFYNLDEKSKMLESTYSYDHTIKTDDDIKKYFNTSFFFIKKTFETVAHKLTPNWLNIFPYTMENYFKSPVYIQFESYRLEKKFPQYSSTNYNEFKLGYHTLYGVIKSFLYDDIKDIKWMIYDINDGTKLYPTILQIVKDLDIMSVVSEPWTILSESKKTQITEKWLKITNSKSFVNFKSLIMFYLRWEKSKENLENLRIPAKCLKILTTNIDNVDNYDEEQNENLVYLVGKKDIGFQLDYCLKIVSSKIKIEKLYFYIYNCCQKFRYTWYGYCCLDEEKQFLTVDNYFKKYLKPSNILNLGQEKMYYLTPKIIYNWFKSLIHFNKVGGDYLPFTDTNSWDNILVYNQLEFVERLNQKKIFFNISANISRMYGITDRAKIATIQTSINEKINSSNFISKVIFECLVYNGIFTYFKYNPEATDNKILPDKNKFKAEWQKKLLEKVSLKEYENSYHFLDNTQLRLHEKLLDLVKNSKWYTNFGADWIAQIQVFHHYIHQRIMFVTGATGAGKSTVYPFMMLYATKIIGYNNNGKVFCTQPRIQPTVSNATWMAEELGIPIKKATTSETDICSNTDVKWIKSNIDYIQFKYADGEIVDDLYHPTLRLMTDGYLYSVMKNDYVFKKTQIENNSLHSDNPVKNFTSINSFDVLLVDESHEHNPYMDMILTLSKFSLYMNNQITLGIVSATMEDDELTYRKYYEPIDDNWKSPLVLNYYDPSAPTFDRGRLDRRIHLSVPFGGMNFTVEEFSNVKKDEVSIVKEILSTSERGDILVFKPGSNEIEKLVEAMNSSLPSDVLAIPFYKDITPNILENVVKKIADPTVRNLIRYPKNYTINQMCDVPKDELLPAGTYKRFIIIATNIAEASITIDTLEYVIDDGQQKIMYYDVETNLPKLITENISVPNYKQRKGRVGRSKPGKAYFTYDIKKLKSKVIYKLCSDNINDKILDLISFDSTYLFTNENNPYLISTRANDESKLKLIPEFLRSQYSFLDSQGNYKLFYHPKPDNKNYSNIIYPHADGKYNMETLIDEEGKFYIIHPNEIHLVRNDELKIVSRVNYKNKVLAMIQYFKKLEILDSDYKITPLGQLLISCLQFFELQIEFILTILDLESFGYSIKNKKSPVFKNLIWYWVSSSIMSKIKLSPEKKVNSDFMAKAELIPDRLLHLIDLNSIADKLDEEFSNLSILIEKKVSKLIFMIPNYKMYYDTFLSMLQKYYEIKIKIEILEELRNPASTIIFYPPDPKDKIKARIKVGQLKRDAQLIKNIHMKNLPKISDREIQIIKSLNNYEQICFFLCLNMKVKILKKIPETKYYINYYNRNYQNIFQIKTSVSPYNLKKIFTLTNVPIEYRNNVIFYLSSDDSNNITDITWIPERVIFLLDKMSSSKIVRNEELDAERMINIYGIDMYNNIAKKIDIINDYIKNH
jgi:hypothetical protein